MTMPFHENAGASIDPLEDSVASETSSPCTVHYGLYESVDYVLISQTNLP